MQTGKFLPELIAPCGMDCAICKAFFGYTMKDEKRKHQCNGCSSRKNPCAFIKQHCDLLRNMKIMYCFECTDFPCYRLSALDKRYRQKSGMSMIDNLKNIKANGMEHCCTSSSCGRGIWIC